MIYIVIIVSCAFFGFFIPKICVSVILSEKEKTVENIKHYQKIITNLSFLGFFFLSTIFCYLAYLQEQQKFEQKKCENAQGVYFIKKNKNVCIEQKAYEQYYEDIQQIHYEYTIELEKASQKLKSFEIKLN